MEKINKNMQAVKSSGSEIELLLGRALWKAGIRYRKNDKSIFGRPDFTLKRYKIAIFADSEFWHGRNWETKKLEHKSNIEFWHEKIGANIKRDKLVNSTLKKQGWRVIRFWGKDIKRNPDKCILKVEKAIANYASRTKAAG